MRYCMLLLLCISSVCAQTPARSWNFRVYLDDRPIGYHRFELRDRGQGDAGSDAGQRRELQSTARFDVKLLFINAYRYAHDATETWQGDCLQQLVSKTDDNGKQLAVTAAPQDAGLKVLSATGRYDLAGCAMSFAYWNPLMLQQKYLLNAQTGEYAAVTIRIVGNESLQVRGVNVLSKHYHLSSQGTTGDRLSIDLWYSEQGEWLALESTTDGGRKLRYVLS